MQTTEDLWVDCGTPLTLYALSKVVPPALGPGKVLLMNYRLKRMAQKAEVRP
jgi:hypothetical protein